MPITRRNLTRPTVTSPHVPAHFLGSGSLLPTLEYLLKTNPDIKPMPGRAYQTMSALPVADQMRLTSIAQQFRHQEDLGPRHGDTRHVSDAFHADHESVRRMVEMMDVEDVADELIRRRSHDMPEPELTRKDQIDAALSAHGFPEE